MAKKVLMLMNLGSPNSTEVKDVKSYLDEFLMDERVIDLPYLLRLLLVKGIITRVRPAKTAEKYKTIWTKNGSPLVYLTKQLTEKVEAHTGIKTYMCMRYAEPTPTDVLKQLSIENKDIEELIFLPLYPHYALSSYETAIEHLKEAYSKTNYNFKLRIVEPFYDDKDYISALSESIKPYLQKGYDHILFSYHGIPERHVKKTDVTEKHCLKNADCCSVDSEAHQYCYRHQVFKTTELVAERLGIDKNKHSLSFQSRLGLDKWLTPNSIDLFSDLPKKGVKKLLVVCPAFVSDCLETLEEIKEEGKEIFLENGGEEFTLIPCLNLNDNWVKAIGDIIKE
jgi:ferrochelatase